MNKLTLLTVITAVSINAFADEFSNLATEEQPLQIQAIQTQSLNITPTQKCVVDPTDPYDPGLLINFGSYKGQCADTTTVRPIQIIKEDQSSFTVANFYHEGRYWIAKIPKNVVTEVSFHGAPFAKYIFGFVIVAHNQLRFKLSQPILLTEQAGFKMATDQVSDLVISSTVIAPLGVEYSLFRGSSYSIVTRMLSTTSRAVEEMSHDGSQVLQFKILRPLDFLNAQFNGAIVKSSEDGYGGRYRLLKENCLTRTFDAWDATLPPAKGISRVEGHWWLIRDEIIKPGLKGLKQRHVDYEQVNNMNTEIKCAKPGEMLGGVLVDKNQLGAASALCRFSDQLK